MYFAQNEMKTLRKVAQRRDENLWKLCQPISNLWNQYNMNRRLWIDIMECKNLIIFINNSWWDLFLDDFIESAKHCLYIWCLKSTSGEAESHTLGFQPMGWGYISREVNCQIYRKNNLRLCDKVRGNSIHVVCSILAYPLWIRTHYGMQENSSNFQNCLLSKWAYTTSFFL